jgi:hypothetical protein
MWTQVVTTEAECEVLMGPGDKHNNSEGVFGRLMETSVQDIGQQHGGESVTFLYEEACFSHN